ncbi:anti-sigma factor antagonist [Carbonactinospora thermoautotrophica]|uniref:Anti-sigma factor antagonist n=1 Tax=Carbonactinospora thermoautotrophica TaxID=1469144 RepID=A0A132ML97_9ACTN|nr:STAS domain-containing protein [Carbonactinospora thermoautotrophica]KWW97719.1 hypothetical protein TH66_19655 [Carbonactinospora thermoautotrophica]KWW98634.1 Stage II sporulation protein [Carbonactinospora thermoautotrophica]KWX08798.1 hypothetical protein TR74_13360 [Carbonactinospora thermoautotrophica]MCX9193458.1 anti-sigma factor antagonist [Carbonactinospora thermoautotrophica]
MAGIDTHPCHLSLVLSPRYIDGGVAVVLVVGELDLHTVRILRDEAVGLIEGGHYRLVFDLSGLTFCDSTGLGAFVHLGKRARIHGGGLRLAALRPQVEKAFRVSGLARTLPISPTVDQALVFE